MNHESSILWVTATGHEAAVLGTGEVLERGYYPEFQRLNDALLITGAGMLATAVELTAVLAAGDFDAIIHFGIAGSFDPSIPPGSVVQVISEEIGDFGADDRGVFLPAFDIHLAHPEEFPFKRGKLTPELPAGLDTHLPKVHGVTVNTVHGEAAAIEAFRARSEAKVESMEGAAVFFAALRLNVPCLQIRAISNFVEPRNRESWEIGKALDALKQELQIIKKKITD